MPKYILTKQEFDTLFKAQYTKLCTFAYGYLDDKDATEEVVQEVFVNFWMQRKKIKHRQALSAYLYKMVKNDCLNFLKHKKTEYKYKTENQYIRQNEELSEHNNEYQNQLSEQVKTIVNKLPEGRREIFILSKYHGLKYKEIAEELGIAVKTVENQMSSAMQFIKEELKLLVVLLILSATFFL
jgi:RNA polymerase sigma-70 factor (ECF subfamily)